ncbi:hypothetical protein HWV62_32441 [Athelia sp. TMB]|nr:hypothetical protein HWV62_32441 [Athelia sp. TMB]
MYCSDFKCCGLHLADLHSLLEHFEEAHVLAGTCVPRADSPSESSPSSSAPSPILPSKYANKFAYQYAGFARERERECPHAGSPPPYGHTASPPAPQYGDDSDAHHHAQYDAYHHVPSHLVHDSELSHALEEPRVASPAAPYPQQISRGEFEHAPRPGPESSPQPVEEAFSPSPSSPQSDQGAGLPPSSFASPTIPQASVASKSAAKPRNARSTRARPYPRKREKVFRCPTAGCSKRLSIWQAYLNPNGLKYHVEKGTCKIEPHPQAAEWMPASA